MASFSITTRTLRTARRALRIPCGRFPTPACPCHFTGMRLPTVTRPISLFSQFPSGLQVGDPMQTWTMMQVRWKSCSSSRQKTRLLVSATRLASALSQMAGEATACSIPGPFSSEENRREEHADQDAAFGDCELAEHGCRASGNGKWKSKYPEVAKLLPRTDVWVDAMRGSINLDAIRVICGGA